jgi:PadR family transcriptional regulator, regulatory protein AphA
MRYMDASLSKTAYVILGMLKLGRRTGYEIKSLVDVSTRFFWAASYGQIYPELQRLEEAGLVRGEREPEDPRRRKAYELTEAGERVLHQWLTSDAPLYFELRHEGLLKFFFSDALERHERVEALRRIRAEHERVAGELRAIEPQARAGAEERGDEHPLLTLDFGVAHQEFMIDWCRRMESRLAASPAVAGGT